MTHFADLSLGFALSPTLINFGKSRPFLDKPHPSGFSAETGDFPED